MKKHWIYSAISTLLLLLALPVQAEQPDENGRYPSLDAMTNEQLLSSVDLGRADDLIRQFQEKEARRLYNGIYKPIPREVSPNVETYRNKEVIIITIPAQYLFRPNTDELTADAPKWLDPLKRYAKPGKEDMYRMLLIMHTDDTGSTAYTDALSLDRVDAVFQYLAAQGLDTSYIFPTAAGATDPLPGTPNNTRLNRAKNRRLEVYLIPGTRMVSDAKKGRIAL